MKSIKEKLAEDKMQHGSYWSLKVLKLLQEMANTQTNAVLQVLVDVKQVETERRYPESGLFFADKHWRAFYHCHEAASMHPDEHGHFHIFTDLGDESWAHVAGLSIDSNGQPLQWFMVNRWVTDGVWLQQENFFQQLALMITSDEFEGLVANWLVSLLQLYRTALFDLLEKRDTVIASHLKDQSGLQVFDDRNIYVLATLPINLQATLEYNLLQDPVNATPHVMECEHVS